MRPSYLAETRATYRTDSNATGDQAYCCVAELFGRTTQLWMPAAFPPLPKKLSASILTYYSIRILLIQRKKKHHYFEITAAWYAVQEYVTLKKITVKVVHIPVTCNPLGISMLSKQARTKSLFLLPYGQALKHRYPTTSISSWQNIPIKDKQ